MWWHSEYLSTYMYNVRFDLHDIVVLHVRTCRKHIQCYTKGEPWSVSTSMRRALCFVAFSVVCFCIQISGHAVLEKDTSDFNQSTFMSCI